MPDLDEIKKNKRARSAKMRIAEKNMKKILSLLNIDFLLKEDSMKNWRMIFLCQSLQ